jgi:hypothetical protein
LKSLPTRVFLFELPIEVFFISGISGPFLSSLFPFLHFTVAEASVDAIAGMFCKHVFRLLLVDDGLLQKVTTDMENCHYKIEFF